MSIYKFNLGLAPEVLRGVCPAPCDQCKRKQIQKVMATMSQEYPYEWNQMLTQFRGR